MIERYRRPEMSRVWGEERRLVLWLEVELAMTATREAEGQVPAGVTPRIRERAPLDAPRAHEIEAEGRDDGIAFLQTLAESVAGDAPHVPVGMTFPALASPAL